MDVVVDFVHDFVDGFAVFVVAVVHVVVDVVDVHVCVLAALEVVGESWSQ